MPLYSRRLNEESIPAIEPIKKKNRDFNLVKPVTDRLLDAKNLPKRREVG